MNRETSLNRGQALSRYYIMKNLSADQIFHRPDSTIPHFRNFATLKINYFLVIIQRISLRARENNFCLLPVMYLVDKRQSLFAYR
jgi:hypothetical protein